MKKIILASLMTLVLLIPATSGFAAAQSYWTNQVTRTIPSNQACGTITHNDGNGYIGTLTFYKQSTFGNEKNCWYMGTMYYQY